MTNLPILVQIAVGLSLISLFLIIVTKTGLLPAVLYEWGVGLFPAWAAEHPAARWGILAVLLLLPALYWLGRFLRWRQEERQARGELLARAVRLTAQRQQDNTQ